jgi:hypothetical protein
MYFDDGLGSSAHVFLRTSDDKLVLFTANVLVISCIDSCNTDESMWFSECCEQVQSTKINEKKLYCLAFQTKCKDCQ